MVRDNLCNIRLLYGLWKTNAELAMITSLSSTLKVKPVIDTALTYHVLQYSLVCLTSACLASNPYVSLLTSLSVLLCYCK